MERATDMTKGSPTGLILRFALPLLLTNLGQQLYLMADAAIVGRGVGVMALASVGATDWIYWMFLWTVMGLTQGFSTFVSRFFGEKNQEALNKTVAMSVLLSAFFGILLTGIGLLSAKPLLLLLNTPADIMDGAHLYLMTMLCGTPVIVAYNMSASILRALGDGRTPLIAMVISAVLNIGLDCLFVFVCQLGIFGAALASVLSQLVSFFYCFLVLRGFSVISPTKRDFRPDLSLIRTMVLFGLPLALEYIVIALGGIALQSGVNLQGSTFIAGYTATNKLYGLLECSAISIGLAASTFLAQNYGAGKYRRVKAGLWSAVKIVLLLSVLVSALTFLLRRPLLRLFLNTDEAVGADAMAIALRYLIILVFLLSILYLIHIFRNALQAMQIASWSMISGVAELLARVAMSKLVIRFMGVEALFWAEPVAWLCALFTVLLPYIYYHKKRLTPKDTEDAAE